MQPTHNKKTINITADKLNESNITTQFKDALKFNSEAEITLNLCPIETEVHKAHVKTALVTLQKEHSRNLDSVNLGAITVATTSEQLRLTVLLLKELSVASTKERFSLPAINIPGLTAQHSFLHKAYTAYNGLINANSTARKTTSPKSRDEKTEVNSAEKTQLLIDINKVILELAAKMVDEQPTLGIREKDKAKNVAASEHNQKLLKEIAEIEQLRDLINGDEKTFTALVKTYALPSTDNIKRLLPQAQKILAPHLIITKIDVPVRFPDDAKETQKQLTAINELIDSLNEFIIAKFTKNKPMDRDKYNALAVYAARCNEKIRAFNQSDDKNDPKKIAELIDQIITDTLIIYFKRSQFKDGKGSDYLAKITNGLKHDALQLALPEPKNTRADNRGIFTASVIFVQRINTTIFPRLDKIRSKANVLFEQEYNPKEEKAVTPSVALEQNVAVQAAAVSVPSSSAVPIIDGRSRGISQAIKVLSTPFQAQQPANHDGVRSPARRAVSPSHVIPRPPAGPMVVPQPPASPPPSIHSRLAVGSITVKIAAARRSEMNNTGKPRSINPTSSSSSSSASPSNTLKRAAAPSTASTASSALSPGRVRPAPSTISSATALAAGNTGNPAFGSTSLRIAATASVSSNTSASSPASPGRRPPPPRPPAGSGAATVSPQGAPQSGQQEPATPASPRRFAPPRPAS